MTKIANSFREKGDGNDSSAWAKQIVSGEKVMKLMMKVMIMTPVPKKTKKKPNENTSEYLQISTGCVLWRHYTHVGLGKFFLLFLPAWWGPSTPRCYVTVMFIVFQEAVLGPHLAGIHTTSLGWLYAWSLLRKFLDICSCTHREILSNQPEIRLYLPCTDWFGTANGQCLFAVPNQSVNGKYNLISGWLDKISERFLCVYCVRRSLLISLGNIAWRCNSLSSR